MCNLNIWLGTMAIFVNLKILSCCLPVCAIAGASQFAFFCSNMTFLSDLF